MIKTETDIANVKRINSGMRSLSRSVWGKVRQSNFRSFTQFDEMFWDVSNRAWLSVDHSAFVDKLEFVTFYWEDYCRKNFIS